MAVANMIDPEKSREGADRGFVRHEIAFAGTSDPIRISAGPSSISAAIHPVSGTARVEFTLSHPDLVEAGTARWITWAKGDVSASAADALISSVTAIRGVCTTNAVIEMCGL